MNDARVPEKPWYYGVTAYQWLVLLIASLGWIFDVFEGQVFVASMKEAMPSLVLPAELSEHTVATYNTIALALFLFGGALGGIAFGRLSDRIGRTKTMILTIATYSIFTFASALSQTWWHLAVSRFLVALGVGGEWAVASAMVAEVFPARARARSSAIFHASSILGTLLAIAVGDLIIGNPHLRVPLPWIPGGELSGWRLGFVLGGVPALLIIWIRISLREPESWSRARAAATRHEPTGGFFELFDRPYVLRTAVGVALAAVGLATFWGVHIYGKDLLRQAKEDEYLEQLLSERSSGDGHGHESVESVRARISAPEFNALLKPYAGSIKRWEMLGMLAVTLGGGLGLVLFGPLCELWGRRGAFFMYHLGGLLISLILFPFVRGVVPLLILLPIFGFLTLGMHAGYAVYFPELFPTRIRGAGTGFCFNAGRILAGPLLFVGGFVSLHWQTSATVLSLLYLLGPVVLIWAPETRGVELQ